jgi:hypothetical protein
MLALVELGIDMPLSLMIGPTRWH